MPLSNGISDAPELIQSAAFCREGMVRVLLAWCLLGAVTVTQLTCGPLAEVSTFAVSCELPCVPSQILLLF